MSIHSSIADQFIEGHENTVVRRIFQSDAIAIAAQNIEFNVAVIDRNALFGECLCAGLQAADHKLTFALYDSVKTWLSTSAPAYEELLLLCLDDREFDSIFKGDNDNINRLRKGGLPARFIVVSSQDGSHRALKALEIGASGYISTSMHLPVVSQVLHLVHAGGTFVPASSLQQLSSQAASEPSTSTPDAAALSPRQILVAKALRKGTPNKVIAYDLNMCESTVKVHVRHIMKKLKAKNRTQVAFLTNAMFGNDD